MAAGRSNRVVARAATRMLNQDFFCSERLGSVAELRQFSYKRAPDGSQGFGRLHVYGVLRGLPMKENTSAIYIAFATENIERNSEPSAQPDVVQIHSFCGVLAAPVPLQAMWPSRHGRIVQNCFLYRRITITWKAKMDLQPGR